jgi:L-threonylcarbamoyladenylate synthase
MAPAPDLGTCAAPGDAVDDTAIERATAALLCGGLVALPTETVYGLAADADQPAAVAAIFDAKGRPHDHPLILHVADAAAADAWARDIGPVARALMARFWPGPLTLILWRRARATDRVTGGQSTVGLRCPSGPWAQALLRSLGAARGDTTVALAAPSANRYGRISPTTAAHVRADLGERPQGLVDVILDGGASTLGIESTIVDCTAMPPRVLRPGSIGRDAIADAIGSAVPIATASATDTATAPRVPGSVEGHYAPRRPLELLAAGHLVARARALHPLRLGVLASPAALAALPPSGPGSVITAIAAAADPAVYAHELYANLRRLDDADLDRLLVTEPPAAADWEAVNDRLRRSAAGSVRDPSGARSTFKPL